MAASSSDINLLLPRPFVQRLDPLVCAGSQRLRLFTLQAAQGCAGSLKGARVAVVGVALL
jgi:hypothetical protein